TSSSTKPFAKSRSAADSAAGNVVKRAATISDMVPPLSDHDVERARSSPGNVRSTGMQQGVRPRGVARVRATRLRIALAAVLSRYPDIGTLVGASNRRF